MKITTYLTDCKRKGAEQSPLLNNLGSEENACLCFRLRDKNLDLKVRTDILVMSSGGSNGAADTLTNWDGTEVTNGWRAPQDLTSWAI